MARNMEVSMAKHPNLVFVFPDEYRKQAMGFMNEDPVLTPNIDRFATESLVLTDAVSTRPVCSPYRAMLFTGQYPHANGVLANVNSTTVEYENYLQESSRCFSDVLHDAGYHQAYLGKLHLDPPNEHYQYTEGPRSNGVIWDSYTPPGPRRHGYDFWHSYGCCDWHFDPHYWTGDDPIDKRLEPKEWSTKHETDVAVKYIKNEAGQYRDSDKPFSLVISHNPPHMPFKQVPEEYVAQYGDATHEDLLNRPNVAVDERGDAARDNVKHYFAMVTGVDENFGRILDCLKEEGLEEDTIVVFTSDHGEMMGSHGQIGKTVHYEESFAVPFIIRWPGKISAGTDDLLIGTPDLMPTLLNLMGVGNVPESVQGADYSSILLGEDGTRPTSALYLNVNASDPAGGMRGVRTHRNTFVVKRKSEGEEVVLHDNIADPYQLENVAEQNPELVSELRQEMNAWLEKNEDPWLGVTGIPVSAHLV